MDDRNFLHDGETLLVNLHPAKSVYIVAFFQGLIEGVIVGFLIATGVWFLLVQFVALGIGIVIALCALAIFRHFAHLKHSSFRVTTERILILHHHGFFKEPLKTIRWDQYQESLVGTRSILDALFRVRPIVIRYGNADSKLFCHFPAIAYADDLKHYLDKAYSLVRAGKKDELKPFILKSRSNRDQVTGS